MVELEKLEEYAKQARTNDDLERETIFALELTNPKCPNSLRWLAAVAALRAEELEVQNA